MNGKIQQGNSSGSRRPDIYSGSLWDAATGMADAGSHSGDRRHDHGSTCMGFAKKCGLVAIWFFISLIILTGLAGLSGCAITAPERCAQAQQAIAIAESLPPSEARDARLAIYRSIAAQNCIAGNSSVQ